MAGNRQCGGRTAPSNGRGLRDAGDAWGGAGQTAAKETKARPVSGQEGSSPMRSGDAETKTDNEPGRNGK